MKNHGLNIEFLKNCADREKLETLIHQMTIAINSLGKCKGIDQKRWEIMQEWQSMGILKELRKDSVQKIKSGDLTLIFDRLHVGLGCNYIQHGSYRKYNGAIAQFNFDFLNKL